MFEVTSNEFCNQHGNICGLKHFVGRLENFVVLTKMYVVGQFFFVVDPLNGRLAQNLLWFVEKLCS